MIRKVLLLSAALALSPALAQVTKDVAETVKVTAKVTAVDPATRTVTIVGPRGRAVSLVAGDEIKNFPHIKVGDNVNVTYRKRSPSRWNQARPAAARRRHRPDR
jgi:hypothetical protein